MRRFLAAALGQALLLAIAFWLALFSVPAMAAKSPLWKQVGPWNLRVDNTIGNSCFMVGMYSGQNTILRIGFDNLTSSVDLLIGNPNWTSLVDGQVYEIGAQLDDGTMQQWHAVGKTMGDAGVVYLRVSFMSQNMWQVMQTFAQRSNMKLWYRGQMLASMNLNGTAAAIAELINCEHQFYTGNQQIDPFSKANDPFSH